MSARPREFIRHGLSWPAGTSDLYIAFFLIRKGGFFKDPDGNTVGASLFDLYREVQSLLWSEDDHHEWSDLALRTILANRITTIQGPKDSSKTRSIAKYALVDYFAFPTTTLILISSTQIRSLELRVWGDLKGLYNRAKEIWPEAPGNVVDSLHGIFTDSVGEDVTTARDIRRGIICIPVKDSEGQWQGMDRWVGIKQKRRRVLADECFPAGTPVLTATGYRPIESIQSGDVVRNATGWGVVLAAKCSSASRLARVKLKDGREIVCTPEHPLLTKKGWKKACEVGRGQFILSPDEALQVLPQADHEKEQDLLLQRLSHSLAVRDSRRSSVASNRRKASKGKREGEDSDADRQSNEVTVLSAEGQRGFEKEGVEASPTRWEWSSSNQSREAFVGMVSSRSLEFRREDWDAKWKRFSDCLQGGCGISRHSTRGRSGRANPQHAFPTGEGRKENRLSSGARVDCVEIQEPGSLGIPVDSTGRCVVFNLQVSGHPSYVVNGLVVHNCQFYSSPFLSTFANLDKGDFKAVLIGNPKGEGDPLDKVSEPKDGWGSEGEITKTMTWENKWGGTTIQLYGPDSPAIRHPGQFVYLTDQADIDRIIQRYGKESAEYWMQAVGVRPEGTSLRRVLTREMARQFGAQEPVVWGTKPTTKVYAIDASYGGDRCVGGSIEFGLDINNVQVIAFNEPVIIPVRMYPKSVPEDQRLLPEDQIATFGKSDCEKQSIPPQNLFFDSTGRGSLGTSFARIWSAAVNPVEFGGAPTPRPVCADMFILDEKTKQRRLKRADEHYSKRVTEFWFSLRYAVEGRQVRQLPNAVLDELAAREWTTVRNDKKELETKEDTKERLGRSPDMADWAVIALEGARRLGFVISRMETPAAAEVDDGWKDDIRLRAASLKRSYTLTYR